MNEKESKDVHFHTEKPKKFLSQKEKDNVHREVDLRLQELEDTGLTRLEILYNQEKGIPLGDDPVFQYLKINRIAREMLIKDNEPFTAEQIVDKALRQDLEPDPTMAKKHRFRYSKTDDFDPGRHYKQKLGDHHPLMNEESYIYGYENLTEVRGKNPGDVLEHKPIKDWRLKRKFDQLDWESERPPTFINKPLKREEARKKFMRNVKKEDFNWKDTVVLEFMTKGGKI